MSTPAGPTDPGPGRPGTIPRPTHGPRTAQAAHRPRRLALHAVIARLLDGWQAEDWATTTPIWVRGDGTPSEDMTPDEARIVADTMAELRGIRAYRATIEAQTQRYPESVSSEVLRARAAQPPRSRDLIPESFRPTLEAWANPELHEAEPPPTAQQCAQTARWDPDLHPPTGPGCGGRDTSGTAADLRGMTERCD